MIGFSLENYVLITSFQSNLSARSPFLNLSIFFNHDEINSQRHYHKERTTILYARFFFWKAIQRVKQKKNKDSFWFSATCGINSFVEIPFVSNFSTFCVIPSATWKYRRVSLKRIMSGFLNFFREELNFYYDALHESNKTAIYDLRLMKF
jgi:hypothetical protein